MPVINYNAVLVAETVVALATLRTHMREYIDLNDLQ